MLVGLLSPFISFAETSGESVPSFAQECSDIDPTPNTTAYEYENEDECFWESQGRPKNQELIDRLSIACENSNGAFSYQILGEEGIFPNPNPTEVVGKKNGNGGRYYEYDIVNGTTPLVKALCNYE